MRQNQGAMRACVKISPRPGMRGLNRIAVDEVDRPGSSISSFITAHHFLSSQCMTLLQDNAQSLLQKPPRYSSYLVWNVITGRNHRSALTTKCFHGVLSGGFPTGTGFQPCVADDCAKYSVPLYLYGIPWERATPMLRCITTLVHTMAEAFFECSIGGVEYIVIHSSIYQLWIHTKWDYKRRTIGSDRLSFAQTVM
jgi:hypothetical protein